MLGAAVLTRMSYSRRVPSFDVVLKSVPSRLHLTLQAGLGSSTLYAGDSDVDATSYTVTVVSAEATSSEEDVGWKETVSTGRPVGCKMERRGDGDIPPCAGNSERAGKAWTTI